MGLILCHFYVIVIGKPHIFHFMSLEQSMAKVIEGVVVKFIDVIPYMSWKGVG